MKKIALILHDIRSTYNVGSIFRSAECFGVEHIFFSGYTPYPTYTNDVRLPHEANKIDKQIAKTALGAERIVPFSIFTILEDVVAVTREAGYSIIGLEQDANSIAIERFLFPEKAAIIVGNELEGVNEWTKEQCDAIIEIKQYGKKESLNVASATAIALFAARTNT